MPKGKMNVYFLIGLIILTGFAVFKMFLPFLATILTAFIFWQLFDSSYKWLVKKTKHLKLSSLISCILVILIIVIPLFVIGSIAANEALGVYKNLSQDSNNIAGIEINIKNFVYGFADDFGIDKVKVDRSFADIDLGEAAKKAAGITANILQQAYQQISQFIFLVFIMLFVLYYLFLDGEKLIQYIFKLSPLGQKEESIIWTKFLSMTRATMKGTLIIAVIQGILGGLSFWVLGIGSPAFWGVVMGIFSVLPLVGPVTIWVPASIWLFVSGAWVSGLILLLIGSLVIGSVDNFLRPKLIGNDTALHPILILIGTFGGIIEFGIMGFIIGPLLITIFVALLEIFEKTFHKELEK